MSSEAFPRQLAVLVLASLACAFAGNHIAARVAFDSGAGLLLAILFRSGVTMVVLAALVLWRRESLRLAPCTVYWQILMGLLIAIQSFCIYSAVALIPVGLALLVVNLSPAFLALLTVLLGGPAPTRRDIFLMVGILFGLCLALDILALFVGHAGVDGRWLAGVLFALCGAAIFAGAMWISENRLSRMAGTVRSLLTMVVVFLSAAIVGAVGLVPGGLASPTGNAGWLSLGVLALLYGVAFSTLFICMPRLDIARNAPVMNVEPVAGLILGWLLLDQRLSAIQLLGGGLVVAGIVLLAYRHRT
ncbi:TPA: DMT family transporter [Pseudomonas aeruginosa]|uniref:EamA family transporter n=1 Tax=Pseudomonas aeruginosa TaxID=287 RepID=UPI000F547095|nr:DMT family transporter [Pseudomonas aeruginosa]HEM7588609.1 DMT family transporter [Serratia marcescens]EKV4129618.1 DMT family transporter [Pseudomonas aeruginosa]EKW1534069.1 DMT family transporter [Pseudomonas aeruginosa]ELQ7976428.1 DMT family transporter [Pseudomonas aeruginosa]ELV3001078.1 DMT family transporter [Pseudomonas aeruginosa]